MTALRYGYLGLAIWGAIHPMYYFLTYMRETGTGLGGLIDAWYVNASTTGLTWDLTIAALTLDAMGAGGNLCAQELVGLGGDPGNILYRCQLWPAAVSVFAQPPLSCLMPIVAPLSAAINARSRACSNSPMLRPAAASSMPAISAAWVSGVRLGVPKAGPAPLLAGAKMGQIPRHAARTAAQMIGHMRPQHRPAQPRPMFQRLVHRAHIGNAFGHDMHRLAPQGCGQTVGDMAGGVFFSSPPAPARPAHKPRRARATKPASGP